MYCLLLLLSLKELKEPANKPAPLPAQHFFPSKKPYLFLISCIFNPYKNSNSADKMETNLFL